MIIKKLDAWAITDWLAMVAAGLLIAIAILTIVPGWSTISVWAGDPAAPAWVQAIGSILAIVAAAAIAGWQSQRHERTERRKVSREQLAKLKVLMGQFDMLEALFWEVRRCHQEKVAVHELGPYEIEFRRVRDEIGKLPKFDISSPELVGHLSRIELNISFVLRFMEAWIKDGNYDDGYERAGATLAEMYENIQARIKLCEDEEKKFQDPDHHF